MAKKVSASKRKYDLYIKYKQVFETPEGQAVLSDLMKTFHVMHSTLSDSPYETHYKEGQRSVVVRIIETLKVDPDQMKQLLELDNQQEEHNALT